jgi:hypothetical protein
VGGYFLVTMVGKGDVGCWEGLGGLLGYLCREKYSRRSCDFAFAMLRRRRLSAVLQRNKILIVSQESYTFLINCYFEL